MICEVYLRGKKRLFYITKEESMITDENGVKHPETVEDQVQLRREEEQALRREGFWNRKAQREGWAKPQHNQGDESEREKTGADRYFEQKARREGWASNKR